MSWFLTIIFLAILTISHPLEAKVNEKKLPSAVVVGTVYCDTCFQEDFGKTSHFISGATVAVECRYGRNSKPVFREEATTDRRGEFKVHLPFSVSKHVKKIEECSVKLISSSEPYCAVASKATSSSALHLKSRRKGTHIFSAGFFTFKPLKQPTLCNEKPSIHNSNDAPDLEFPPSLKDPNSPGDLPPLPSLPPILPPLPNLPPLPPLPPLPKLPPLPALPGLLPPLISGDQKTGTTTTNPSTKSSLTSHDQKTYQKATSSPTSSHDHQEVTKQDFFFPPNPFQPPPLIPNPFQPPPLIPNPFQPPPAPLIPNPFQPPPAPLIPNPFQPPPAPLIPNPFQPPPAPTPLLPFPPNLPIPGLTPSPPPPPPPPAFPFPFPPLPFPPPHSPGPPPS